MSENEVFGQLFFWDTSLSRPPISQPPRARVSAPLRIRARRGEQTLDDFTVGERVDAVGNPWDHLDVPIP